jgi:hypothetical protein
VRPWFENDPYLDCLEQYVGTIGSSLAFGEAAGGWPLSCFLPGKLQRVRQRKQVVGAAMA